MKTLLNILIKLFGKQLGKIILVICNAICSFFNYKVKAIDQKKEAKEAEKIEKFHKEIDNVTENGSLEDLLNLRK